jgi:hypothetical protein
MKPTVTVMTDRAEEDLDRYSFGELVSCLVWLYERASPGAVVRGIRIERKDPTPDAPHGALRTVVPVIDDAVPTPPVADAHAACRIDRQLRRWIAQSIRKEARKS